MLAPDPLTNALFESLDLLGQWVWVFDGDQNLRYANAPAQKLAGDAVVGQSFDAVLAALGLRGPQEQDCARAAVAAGGAFQCEFAAGMAGSFAVHPLSDGGFSIIGRNVSIQQETLNALSVAEERLDAILDRMTDIFYRTDGEGRLVLVSRAVEGLLGYSREEILGKNLADFYVDANGREKFLKALQDNNGSVVGYEAHLYRKDGSVVWVSTNAYNYVDADGNVAGVEGITRDVTDKRAASEHLIREVEERTHHLQREITERRQIEEALRVSEERYALAMEAAQEGLWDWDLDSDVVYLSPRVRNLAGIADVPALSAKTFLENHIHPGDREQVRDRVVGHLKGQNEFLDCEYRMVRPDGAIRWVQNRAVGSRNIEGRVTRVVGAVVDITERRRMEEAMHESEARFRDITEAASDWYWEVDRDMRFTFVSDRFFGLSGLRPSVMLGEPREVVETFPGFKVDAEKIADYRDRVGGQKSFRNFEYSFLKPDQERIYVRISGKPYFSADGRFRGYRGVGSDITVQVRTEERMHEAQRQLSEAIETIADGFVVFDHEDRLVTHNSKYVEMHEDIADVIKPGVSFGEIVRAAAERGVFPDAIGRVDEWLESRLAAHFSPTNSMEQEFSNGRWLSINERRMPGGGVVGIRSDITELKHSEQRLREAITMAEQANQAKSEFLANMSHELRTPLNAIIGFSDVMRTEVFGPIGQEKYSEYTAAIHQSGQHLLALVEDLLDVARIEAGKLELHEEDISITDSAEACLALVRERALEAGITLETDIPVGFPMLYVDLRRFRQILINLLSNAVKFTPENGKVVLGCRSHPTGGIDVYVSDTGIGMSVEEIGKAREPFGQAEGALSKRYEGTGLGLPLVEGLMAINGGALDIESEPGKGTVVTVRFPAERVRPAETPALVAQ